MASLEFGPEVIDVDADEPPRIAGGTGAADAPLELASSDSEDESPAMALVHDHRLLHESPKLRVGVKHVIRTDVMYERV